MGMWGAEMGDSRKPLIWPDYDFESEIVHPFGRKRTVDKVKFNYVLFKFYQKLIQIRMDYPVLKHGDIEYVLIDNTKEVLAYSRFDDKSEVLAVFNISQKEQTIIIPLKFANGYSEILSGSLIRKKNNNKLEIILPSRTSSILVNKVK